MLLSNKHWNYCYGVLISSFNTKFWYWMYFSPKWLFYEHNCSWIYEYAKSTSCISLDCLMSYVDATYRHSYSFIFESTSAHFNYSFIQTLCTNSLFGHGDFSFANILLLNVFYDIHSVIRFSSLISFVLLLEPFETNITSNLLKHPLNFLCVLVCQQRMFQMHLVTE